MTAEQKQAMEEAKAAEMTVLLIELDKDQQNVAKVLGLTIKEQNVMAKTAFASNLRGKLQSSIDKAIKDKYAAESKGHKQDAEALEVAIQEGIKLKKSIS